MLGWVARQQGPLEGLSVDAALKCSMTGCPAAPAYSSQPGQNSSCRPPATAHASRHAALPLLPPPSNCSFAWRDKCNRCGKGKDGGGGGAPAAGGYDAGSGAGGYGGYDAAPSGGYGGSRSEPVRAAPQGPPGGLGFLPAGAWKGAVLSLAGAGVPYSTV